MSRHKKKSTSPQSSASSTGSSSSSSSSSSSGSSSSDSSSSDTEQSSAASTTRGSSESENDVSQSSKRGPKTSATSVPKSSQRKNSCSKISSSVNKSSQPRHQKQGSQSTGTLNLPPRRSSSSSSVQAKKIKKSSTSETPDKKKSKKIKMSADNSSDSDGQQTPPKTVSKKQLKTPSMSKTSSSKKSKQVSKEIQKNTHKSTEKSADKSSEGSTNSSSDSSDSDSDSSSGSSASEKTTGLKRKTSPETEGDVDSPRRLITRSSNVKTKRSSLLGVNKATDSDSDNPASKFKPRSARKKTPNKSAAIQEELQTPVYDNSMSRPPKSKARSKTKKPPIHKNIIEMTPLPLIDLRKCPVDGCDSSGHLGGSYERHFSVEACPVFHNFTKEETKSFREQRKIDLEDHERAVAYMNSKSPKPGPNNEQKNYCNKIRDSRDCMSEVRQGDEEMADSDRQPSLRGLTPDWDLKLFLQAQAEASEKTEDEMKGLPDTKGIRFIQMGHYEMQAWYQSQYPEDYNQQPKIFVCEFCLKYMRSRTILNRHATKCVWKHPPGDEIYRKEKLSVWEVDGTKYKTYCQNLCLLAMLFLDHKTLYYDVEPFLFYIMTLADSEGCHIIGYFSKEKNSFLNYNVSCIMTLPPYQRKGFGRLLIDFSYLLTKEEGKIGSPEKPLSDLGLISYRSYWKDLLLKYLTGFCQKNVSIKDISQEMAVNSYDIVSTFQAMGMMKYWKGKHILVKRQDLFEDFEERYKRRRSNHREIVSSGLDWRPYVPPPTSHDAAPSNNNNHNSNNNNTHINPKGQAGKKPVSSP